MNIQSIGLGIAQVSANERFHQAAPRKQSDPAAAGHGNMLAAEFFRTQGEFRHAVTGIDSLDRLFKPCQIQLSVKGVPRHVHLAGAVTKTQLLHNAVALFVNAVTGRAVAHNLLTDNLLQLGLCLCQFPFKVLRRQFHRPGMRQTMAGDFMSAGSRIAKLPGNAVCQLAQHKKSGFDVVLVQQLHIVGKTVEHGKRLIRLTQIIIQMVPVLHVHGKDGILLFLQVHPAVPLFCKSRRAYSALFLISSFRFRQ